MEMLFNKDFERTTSANKTSSEKSEHRNERSWGDWVRESASETYAVVKDLGSGAANELVNHPLHVAEQAAMGAGIGAGLELLSPKAAWSAGIVGTTAGTEYLYQKSGNWLKSAAIVAGLKCSTPQEAEAAHADLRELGAWGMDFAAAALGGLLMLIVHGTSVEKFGLKSLPPFTHPSDELSASRHIRWAELNPLSPELKNPIGPKPPFSPPSSELKGVPPLRTGADGTPFTQAIKDSPLPKSPFNPPKLAGYLYR